MAVPDTHGSETEHRVEPVEESAAGLRGLLDRTRRRLAEWSEVHARQQVELLAGKPPQK